MEAGLGLDHCIVAFDELEAAWHVNLGVERIDNLLREYLVLGVAQVVVVVAAGAVAVCASANRRFFVQRLVPALLWKHSLPPRAYLVRRCVRDGGEIEEQVQSCLSSLNADEPCLG